MLPPIQMKGTRDGLLVNMGQGEWKALCGALLSHINEHAEFLRGAQLTIDVAHQPLSVSDLSDLRNDFSDKGITLWEVVSDSPIRGGRSKCSSDKHGARRS